jgi:hypothetical protein
MTADRTGIITASPQRGFLLSKTTYIFGKTGMLSVEHLANI